MPEHPRESCVAGGDCILPSLSDWRVQMRETLAMLRTERGEAYAERDRAIETRENANAVSLRLEAENRRLREALRQIAQEANEGGVYHPGVVADSMRRCAYVVTMAHEALNAPSQRKE